MSLSLDDVRRVRFRMARRNAGYEVGDVDIFIDKVESTFMEFENEREILRREVEAAGSVGAQQDPEVLRAKDAEIVDLRAEVDRLRQAAAQQQNAVRSGDGEDRAELDAAQKQLGDMRQQMERMRAELNSVSQDRERARQELQRSKNELEAARSQAPAAQPVEGLETLVVTTSQEASVAVTRLVQLSTEQAEQVVLEAQAEADRKLEAAQQQAHEITVDARTRAERIESEARVNADQMRAEARNEAETVRADARTDAENVRTEARTEAESLRAEARANAEQVNVDAAKRRDELFSELERQHELLVDRVAHLRDFEANYRSNLRGYFTRELEALDNSRPEPADAPDLQTRSTTPRLDALANQAR